MIGEMYTPPMYRDAISSGMPMFELDPTTMGMGTMYGMGMYDPMGMGIGMGMYGGAYNTNFLGDVRLKPNLNRDTVEIIRAKDKEAASGMSTAAKIALGILGIGIARAFFKGRKIPAAGSAKKWYKPWTWLKKSTSTTTTSSGRSWYKPWTWLKKP